MAIHWLFTPAAIYLTPNVDNFQRRTVFLLSMRAGAVGINLTAANYIFLMEPCLNPALEDQAIGRSWRMGQTRQVRCRPCQAYRCWGV